MAWRETGGHIVFATEEQMQERGMDDIDFFVLVSIEKDCDSTWETTGPIIEICVTDDDTRNGQLDLVLQKGWHVWSEGKAVCVMETCFAPLGLAAILRKVAGVDVQRFYERLNGEYEVSKELLQTNEVQPKLAEAQLWARRVCPLSEWPPCFVWGMASAEAGTRGSRRVETQ